jgi:hypothetical protein
MIEARRLGSGKGLSIPYGVVLFCHFVLPLCYCKSAQLGERRILSSVYIQAHYSILLLHCFKIHRWKAKSKKAAKKYRETNLVEFIVFFMEGEDSPSGW